ncbi:MAG: hypothetical protein KDD36_05580 [Flavobacteriales bacterium]|nr:hypothetical protein [Flavobacteriales bacterium]
MGNKHSIAKQKLELQCNVPGNQGQVLQNTISRIYRQKVLLEMEKLFDSYGGKEEVFVIDKLEIDLGVLDKDRLEADFPSRVKEALAAKLPDIISGATTRNPSAPLLTEKASEKVPHAERRSAHVHELESIIRFLETGQHYGEIRGTLSTWLKTLITEHPKDTVSVLRRCLLSPHGAQRLVYQCPDKPLIELLAAILPGKTDLLTGLYALAKVGLPQSGDDRSTTRWKQWQPIIYWTITTRSTDVSSVAQLIRVMVSGWDEQTSTRHAEINHPLASAREIQLSRTYQSWRKNHALSPVLESAWEDMIGQLPGRSGTDSKPIEPERKDKDGEQKGETNKVRVAGKTYEKEISTVKENNRKSGEESKREVKKSDTVSTKNEKHPNGQSKEELRPSDGKSTPLNFQNQKSSRKEDAWPLPKVEEAFVKNAGVVILHSLLPFYFEGLGLVKDKQFVSESKQMRAVHLLQYLVDGRCNAGEEELTLNKLLCGMEPSAPVISKIRLTKSEKSESQALLEHVVKQWTVLKNASPASIQQTFLQREGLLSREGFGGGWKLNVERQTVDILMDRLPWGISLVMMPWNKSMIHVEW